MKRYIKANTQKASVIEITLHLQFNLFKDTAIAAETYITNPKQITKNNQLDESALHMFNTLIGNVLANVRSHGFKITDNYPSWGSDGVSYYIKFLPTLDDGTVIGDRTIIIRMSNHFSLSAKDSENVQFMFIEIGNTKVPHTSKLLDLLDTTFTDLKSGDLAALDTFALDVNRTYINVETDGNFKIYTYQDLESVVAEVSRKEALQYAKEYVESWQNGYGGDGSVYIEYDDGSYFYADETEDINLANFKKQHIKTIIIDDGNVYTIYGPYVLDSNLIPQLR